MFKRKNLTYQPFKTVNSADFLYSILSNSTLDEIVKFAQTSNEFSIITKEYLSQNQIRENGFNKLAFTLGRSLKGMASCGEFSHESNCAFIIGSDLISSVGFRHVCCISTEELDSHIEYETLLGNSSFNDDVDTTESSKKIKTLTDKGQNGIVLNQQGSQAYLINFGTLNVQPFPLRRRLTSEELAFLEKQPCDKNGCLEKTAENQEMLGAIEKKIRVSVGDPIDLSLNEKLRHLTMYLVGTLIHAMTNEDGAYGPQVKFGSQLLYPPGEHIKINYRSIEDLGRAVLDGKLPFSFDMIRREVFGHPPYKQLPPGLHTVTQLKSLLKHFNIGVQEEKVTQQNGVNQNTSNSAATPLRQGPR